MNQQRRINSPLSFACGAMAINILMMLFQSYSNNYYVEVLGLMAIYATIAKVIMLLFDGGINLYVGIISDNNQNQKGRRYPWLVATTPFYALITVFVFVPLPGGQLIILSYFLVMMLLFQLVVTFQFVNYGALFPVIFTGEKERIRAANWRQALFFVGLIIGIGCPPILFEQIGHFYTALLFGLIYLGFFTIFLLNTREPKEQKHQPVRIKEGLKLFKEKRFLLFTICNALLNSILGIIITVFPFLAEYHLLVNGAEATFILLTLLLVAISATFIWRPLLERSRLTIAFFLSIVILCLGLLLLYFRSNLPYYLLCGAVTGFGLAGVFVIQNILQSRLLDEDYKKHGKRREATFGAIGNLVQKVAMILSAVLFGAFCFIYGYESGNNPGPRAGEMFRVLICITPLVLGGLALVLAYLLDRDYLSTNE